MGRRALGTREKQGSLDRRLQEALMEETDEGRCPGGHVGDLNDEAKRTESSSWGSGGSLVGTRMEQQVAPNLIPKEALREQSDPSVEG